MRRGVGEDDVRATRPPTENRSQEARWNGTSRELAVLVNEPLYGVDELIEDHWPSTRENEGYGQDLVPAECDEVYIRPPVTQAPELSDYLEVPPEASTAVLYNDDLIERGSLDERRS
jgi:hypothetical protein